MGYIPINAVGVHAIRVAGNPSHWRWVAPETRITQQQHHIGQMRSSSLLQLLAALLLTAGLAIQIVFVLTYRAAPPPVSPAGGPLPPAQAAQPSRTASPTCDAWSCHVARQLGKLDTKAVAASPKPAAGQQKKEPTLSPPTPSVAAAAGDPVLVQPPLRAGAHEDYFCLNKAVAGDDLNRVDTSSMASFISSGGRFPIMIVTKDRAAMLRSTLASLLHEVRCVDKQHILVVQDGDNAAVSQVATEAGVLLHMKKIDPATQFMDGAAKIAMHYKYALGYALRTAFPTAPAVIVAEDDFLFSPDFYEYFHAVAPVIEADPTLWLASAWNDNGFDYLVANPNALKRTGYFPGLGWLLPRAVWEQEIGGSWPDSHWDHWMRDPARSRGRDIVIPEIPRDYHAGVKGTFMDQGTHNKYFGSIALQADPGFTWDTQRGADELAQLMEPAYSDHLGALISSPSTMHLSSVAEIAGFKAGVGVVWYECATQVPDHAPMRALAAFFGIWHEGARGSRGGVHDIWWLGTARLLLINVYSGAPLSPAHVSGSIETAGRAVLALMPPGHTPLPSAAFEGLQRPVLPLHSDLFGAVIRSPLAHLDGGPDANGPPDLDAGAGPQRPPAPEQDGGAAHEHMTFLSDLKLGRPSPAAAPQALKGGGKAVGFKPVPPPPAPAVPGLARVKAAAAAQLLQRGLEIIPAPRPGMSCTEVCAGFGAASEPSFASVCNEASLPMLNSCDVLQGTFPCRRCSMTEGPDMPAFVDPSAPADKQPSACLRNVDRARFSCEGSYDYSVRLCTCTTIAGRRVAGK